MTRKDQEEVDRLELLEDFERLKFYPWLEWMAATASLSVSDLLTVLSHGVTDGFILDFKVTDQNGSSSFRRWDRFRGHTPIETACLMFVADHWRAGVPIPAREILWNKEWGGKRVDLFRSTLAYINHVHTL
jgi:hypothetical protein